jgi:hypothetical protein
MSAAVSPLVLVVVLDTMRQAFALEILLFSIALSLESHRHLRTSIIDCSSIAGELVSSSSSNLFVRDRSVSLLLYIPHRPLAHPAETTVVKRFQYLPVFFFQSPAFAPPECYVTVPTPVYIL